MGLKRQKRIICSVSVLILFLLNGHFMYAQKNETLNDLYLGINYQKGMLLPEYDFFYLLTEEYVQALELNAEKEFAGKKLWQRVYNYPSAGISFVYSTLGNNEVFGRASAISPYLKFKLIDRKRFSMQYKLGAGLCYVSEFFDLETNYGNIAVGSHLNLWFNTELIAAYSVFQGVSLYAGTGFHHLSNANLSEPNIGLNTWTFLFGTDVQITALSNKDETPIPELTDHNRFAFVLAGGNKITRRFAEQRYFTASASFEYKRILGHKIALGSGADIFYDASVPDEMVREGKSDSKNIYKLKSGFHISQELMIGRLSLTVQEGVYVFFTDKLNEQKMYNRGIIRYRISDHLFANVAMKSNLFILDVMEIGIGYYWE